MRISGLFTRSDVAAGGGRWRRGETSPLLQHVAGLPPPAPHAAEPSAAVGLAALQAPAHHMPPQTQVADVENPPDEHGPAGRSTLSIRRVAIGCHISGGGGTRQDCTRSISGGNTGKIYARSITGRGSTGKVSARGAHRCRMAPVPAGEEHDSGGPESSRPSRSTTSLREIPLNGNSTARWTTGVRCLVL